MSYVPAIATRQAGKVLLPLGVEGLPSKVTTESNISDRPPSLRYNGQHRDAMHLSYPANVSQPLH